MMARLVKQKSITVTGVSDCVHISHVTSEQVCISDYSHLILTNTAGEDLHHLTDIVRGGYGVHTVNGDNDLIYIDREYNINKLSTVNKVKSTLIKYTAPWRPQCVYSSPSTGDLLVGMFNTDTGTAKVTQYNSTGENIQTIQHNNTGQELYRLPRYITENHNGDVIVSDFLCGVVVTERGGRHRFSYTGPPSGSGLTPLGICTEELSHILVCDYITDTVQIIDKDGHFLSQIKTQQQWIDKPMSLSYDVNTHLLWVGSFNTNIVNIYRCICGDSLTEKPSGYAVEVGDLPSGSTKNVPDPSDYVLLPPMFRIPGFEVKLKEKKKPSGYAVEVGDLPSGSTKNVPDPSDYVLPPPKKIRRTGREVKLKEKKYRVPMIIPGISSCLKRSTTLSRIDSLENRTPRRESDSVLHSIEYIDCNGICGRSTMHCYSGTIEACNQFSIQGIMEWTRDCSEKLREARSQKCKCFVGLFCVLITIETKGVLANVKVNKLEFIVKHFVDFAIESRNYILLSELVRLHGFQLDFKLETIFAKTSKMINNVTVDTIVQSAKCMIVRRYSSLLQNSIQLSLSYDCEKGNCVTIVLSYEGTIEMMDIGQERVMGKKLVFYNDTKPSDEASSIFKSFATSCSRETLPRVTAKVARKLFNKHSNLTMISASPYKSVGYSKGKHKLMKQSCILLLCRHKGYIPYGEEEFPRRIEDFEVDVQEGYCTFGMGGSLEMGGHIRRKGSKSSGSIGGFLYRNGKKALITCAHVVLSVQELGNRDINSANNADEVEAYIRKTRSYQVCGKVVRAEFPNNSTPNECSVDAAIIELDSSFGNSDFRSVAAEQLISAGFDADNPVVFRGRVIPNERIQDISGSVVKFGAKTGFTVGSLFHENMHVRISIKESLKLFDILGSSEITCDVNVYNQMEIEGLTEQFFEVGDSGSFVFCIQDDTISCIGMAIGLTTRGTCLVTPIENILKSFGLSVKDTNFFPAKAKLQSKIETDKILHAIAQMKSSLKADMEEQRKNMQEIKKDIEKIKKNE